MANLQKLPSGKWRARYRDETGRQHARHFDRKVDGTKWLASITASVERGDYVDPKAGKVTLRQYATQWQSSQVGRANTLRIADNALRLHIFPVLGDKALASIRRSDVQALIKGVSERLAAGTTRNVHDTLARVMLAAVEDRLISSTPCRKIVLPAAKGGDVVPPTVEEVQLLAGAVDARYRALIVTLAGTGLRIGEALGLEVADIDFLRRTMRVERQRLQDDTLGPTKTAGSTRTIPLGQVVVDELAAHLAEYGADGPLWPTEVGQPLTYRQWKRVWTSARQATGLDYSAHDMRHFCASALISGGASIKQVQTFLGHSSAAITLKVYAHMWPGDDDRTRAVMDEALRNLGDCLGTEAASGG